MEYREAVEMAKRYTKLTIAGQNWKPRCYNVLKAEWDIESADFYADESGVYEKEC